MDPRNFFSELKRRNVYKVAVAYAVVGWLVIQVAATIVPALHLAEGITTAVVVIVLLGFPIALVIAWAFEMTPEGMKRTEDVRPDEKIPQWSRRKFAALILVIAIAAASLLGYQVFRAKPSAPSSASNPEVPLKSIAVLPFESLSEDKANAYFAEGIQEEILTRLSKIADLKVISRTSTQRYKSAPNDLREIAKQLGVANILEGSVQKANDQVRISVQLINALNDSHLWAETYDRKLIDVFQIETDLAQKIASSLEAKLSGREKKEISFTGTNNPEAYDAYLHSIALSNRQSVHDLEEAIKFVRRAVELDPNYAQAWCWLAIAESQKYFYPEHTAEQLAKARTAVENVTRLAPDSAEKAGALGIFNYYCLRNYDVALAQLQIAHERAPNDANSLLAIGLVKRRQGHIEESIAVQQEAAALDPLNEDIWVNLGRGFRGLRRFDEARTMFDRAHALVPNDNEVLTQRAETYAAQGDVITAWKIMEPLEFPPADRGFGAKLLLLIFQRRFDEAEQIVVAALARKDIPPLFVAISHSFLAQVHLAKGDRASAEPLLAQAESELKQLRAAGDDSVLLRSILLEVEAYSGHQDEARALIDSLLETDRGDAWQLPRTEETVARAYVALHDFDRAIPLLEHALSVPAAEGITRAYLRLDPWWDPIRNDPRFQKLANAK
jgi:TolB-like protein/Flp pilus assembly protein TadD